MTWSIHTILWLQLREHDLAEKFFNSSYQPHVTKPFGIWTENRWAFNQEYILYIRKYIVICPNMGIDGPKNVAPEIHRKCRQPNFGAVNFLTGMGGFLQVDISICRVGNCHSRHSQRQCKNFASGVNFSRNNAIYNRNESTKYILY